MVDGIGMLPTMLKKLIPKRVENGCTSFPMRYSPESPVKSEDHIHLIIVVPSLKVQNRLFLFYNDIFMAADSIVVAAEQGDPDAYGQVDAWIVEHSKRIIYAHNYLRAIPARLQKLDISAKELIIVSAALCGPHKTKHTKNDEYDYPLNLLCDILQTADLSNVRFPHNIQDRLEQSLATYDSKTSDIMKMRYADYKSLQEIGNHYGITRENVRQIIESALWSLRSHESYLYLFGAHSGDSPVVPDIEYRTWHWSAKEDKELLNEFDSGMSIEQIADNHHRKASAVIYHLQKLTGKSKKAILKRADEPKGNKT